MMKVIDFHPDDLFDREIAGTITADERRRLLEHLDRCMQCRLERQLRSDFEVELGSRGDATNLQSFVTGALRATRSPASRRPSRKAVNAWRRRFVFLFAATMVLATGLAAAETDLAGRAWHATREKIAFVFRAPRPATARESASAFEKEKPKAEAPVALGVVSTPEPGQPNVAPRVAPDSPAPAARPVVASERRAAVRRVAVEKAPVAVSAPVEEAPAPIAAEERSAKPRESASTLFDDANAARRRGRMLEAAGLYRDLQARFPASAEARLSVAVVARMQLDLGETASAASGFAAYLATGDRALREEAMAGRAIALGRLGRTSDESAAWRELLRAYPGSSYAKVARSRLGQDLP
jgi:TolA-binding protein